MHANFVLQKCVELLPAAYVDFIVEGLEDGVLGLRGPWLLFDPLKTLRDTVGPSVLKPQHILCRLSSHGNVD